MRFMNYFLCQLMESLGDSNPYEDMRERLRKRLDPFGADIDPADAKVKNSTAENNRREVVDLMQTTQVTGLDIMIENPLIILKDRPYLPTCLRLDLGLIQISSKTQPICGRWRKHINREVFVNSLLIDARSMRIDCLSHAAASQVMPPFDLVIDYESINSSPLLLDGHLSPGIDFDDLQIQEKITIRTFEASLEMKFKPAIYTYLMRCLDLNINYVDELDAHFQFYNWNSSNAMKSYNLWKQIVR